MMKATMLEDKFASAARLKKIREDLGYTQERFAEILGISLSGYIKIENGRNRVSENILRKLHENLNVSADYILFGVIEDDEILWDKVKKSTEADKMALLIRLLLYFTEIKAGAFDTDEKLSRYDGIITKIVAEIKKNR